MRVTVGVCVFLGLALVTAGCGPAFLVLAGVGATAGVTASSGGGGGGAPPQAANLVASGISKTQTAGTALAEPLTVVVVDASGAPVGGIVVTFAVTAGGGFVAPDTAVTDGHGKAEVRLVLGTRAGTNLVTASVPGLPPITFSVEGTAGPPSWTKIASGDGQTAVVGTSVPDPLLVTVTDAFGNAIPGVVVTFSIVAGGGSFASNDRPLTDASGRAQVRLVLGGRAGSNVVEASAPGTVPVTFQAGGATGAPAILSASGTGQSQVVGSTLASPFVVRVADGHGNPVVGALVSYAVTRGGGTLTRLQVTTDTSGSAATTLTLGTLAGPNDVSAAVTGFAPVTFTAAGVPGPMRFLAATSGDAQVGSPSAPLPLPLVVTARDSFGNPVGGVAVTFTVIGGAGSVAPATAATDASGRASTSLTLGPLVGTNGVQAVASGTPAVTFTETAALRRLLATAGGGQTGALGKPLPAPFVATVTDGGGTPVPGAVVAFSVTAGGGSLSATSVAADASGCAATTLTLGPLPGTNTVAATTSGTTAVTFSATAVVAPRIVAVNPSGATAGQTVNVVAADAAGTTAIAFSGVNQPSFTVLAGTTIVATVPAGAPLGAGSITVTTPGGTSTWTNFTVLGPPPVITSFSPRSGGPGTVVTIRGDHFTGATWVRFGGGWAPSFTVDSPTQIRAVIPGGSGSVAVTTSNGTGTTGDLLVAAPSPDAGVPPRSLVLADLNGDGRLDLAVAGDSRVGVLLGNGDGTFGTVATVDATPGTRRTIVADVSADGRPDLVATNSGDGTVSTYLGNGDGTFLPAIRSAAGPSAGALASGDLNGDGALDVVAATTSGVSVLLGVGDGTYGAPLSTSLPAPLALALVDANGDGRLDLVSQNPSAIVGTSLLLGNGDGSFQTPTSLATGTWAPVVGDVNGDRRADVVTGGWSGSLGACVTALLGYGDGTFGAAATRTSGLSPSTVVLGDVNGDGRPDVVLTGSSSQPVGVLVGNGDGTFQGPWTYPGIAWVRTLAAGDLNGDGASDVVVADWSSPKLLVYVANPAGFFTFITPPTITRFEPTTAVPGETVTITGTHLSTATSVLLGGVSATFSASINGTTLAAVVPAGASAGPIVVTTATGVATSAGTFYSDRSGPGPVVKSFSPTSGGAGTTVTITGSGFTRAAAVTFGGSAVQSFTVDSPTQITAVLGPGASGPVAVTTPSGSFTTGGLFATASTFAANIAPTVLTTCDLNGDGRIDVLTGGATCVLLGSGNGTFQTPLDYDFGDGVATGDLNGDGKQDFVVASWAGYAGLRVWTGRGDGTFVQNGFTFGPAATWVAVADVNGDGKLDLVTVQVATTNNVSVLLGNGDGTFQAPVSQTVGNRYPRTKPQVAVGDLNGDGKLDIIAAFDTVYLLLGNGDGTLRPPASYTSGSTPSSVALGDLNGDGKLDVVLASSASSTVAVLLGNGDGTLAAPMIQATGSTSTSVVLGDLNGDGKLDVVTANSGAHSVTVQLGRGDGTFGLRVDYAAGRGAAAVSAGDTDGDGVLDLVVANAGGGVTVLLGRGDGTFGGARQLESGVVPGPLAVGDVNGDGVPDLAVGAAKELRGGETLALFLGSGDGTFRSIPGWLPGPPSSRAGGVLVVDVNGDSKLDLVVVVPGGRPGVLCPVSVLLGRGDGTFGPPADFDTGKSPVDVAAADLNRDGNLDLFVTTYYGSASVLLGRGDGTFGVPTAFAAGPSPGSPAIADFNGDGMLDVAVANPGLPAESGFSLLLGNGDGTLKPVVTTLLGGEYATSLKAVDVNGDGRLDLVYADSIRGVGVLLGRGDGTFDPPATFFVGVGQDLAFGDVNQDGIPDLVVGLRDDAVAVRIGVGNGTFVSAGTIPVGAGEARVTLTDTNKDGRLDVVVGSPTGRTLTVLLGTPAGFFTYR